MKKLKDLLLVVASSSLLGITSLQAIDGWQPVQTVANNGNGVSLGDLIINGNNTALAIYTITQDKTVGTGTFQRARVKFHSVTDWDTGVFVSPLNLDAVDPKVGIGNNQNAVAIWSVTENNVSRIQYSLYTEPNWSAPQNLTNPINSDSSLPALAVSRNGYAVAVWQSVVNGIAEIHGAYLNQETKLWTHTGRVSRASDFLSRLPKVALDENNNAYATWLVENGANLSTLSGAVLPANKTAWRFRAVLSDPLVDASSPDIVAGPDGYAVAVWQHKSIPSEIRSSVYNTAVSETTWTPKVVSIIGNPVDPSVALNRVGIAVAAWKNKNDPSIKASILPFNALIWNAELEASVVATNPRNPKAGIDGDGNSVAVWQEGTTPGSTIILSSILLNGGLSWGSVTQISSATPAGPPLLAVSPRTDSPPNFQTIAAWNVDTRIQSAYNPDLDPPPAL